MTNEQLSTLTEPLSRAFASTRSVLVQVRAEQLGAPTPCASWDVRAVINHVTDSAHWAATVIGSGGESADRDVAASDFIAAYDQAAEYAFRGPDGAGLFGPPVQAPAGASPAGRLAAFLGRPVVLPLR